jgi:tight adherence protein C
MWNYGKRSDLKKKRIDDIKDSSDKNQKRQNVKEKKSLKEVLNQIQKNNKKKHNNKNNKKREKSNKQMQALDGMLQTAGWDVTAEQFSALKIALAMIMMVLSLIICKIAHIGMLYVILVMSVIGIVAIIMPGRILKMKVKNRQDKIRMQMPDVMDLLVVSVEAGLGFDAALLRLYEKDKSELMTELIQAIRDIQRGMGKKEAYESLAKRCNIKELTTFLTALVQAEQLGISVKSVLKVQAQNLRTDRKQQAEEKALKAPVKMLIPMVMFIFPVIFIILLGPAILNMIEVF